MKVLIAGGAGFIGSTVASACLDDGHRAGDPGQPRHRPGRVHPRPDLLPGRHRRRRRSIDRIFAEHPDIAAVVHAAAPSWCRSRSRSRCATTGRTWPSRSTSSTTSCATAAAATCSARRPSIYRPGDDFSVDEGSALEPPSPYARTKVVMEEMLADRAAAYDAAGDLAALLQPDRRRPAAAHRACRPRARPHLLGKLLTAAERGRGVRAHRRRLAHPRRLGHPRLHPRLGPGRGPRRRAAAVRQGAARPARAVVRRDQPRHRAAAPRCGSSCGVPGRVPAAAAGPRGAVRAGRLGRLVHPQPRARELLGWTPQFSIEDGIRHSCGGPPSATALGDLGQRSRLSDPVRRGLGLRLRRRRPAAGSAGPRRARRREARAARRRAPGARRAPALDRLRRRPSPAASRPAGGSSPGAIRFSGGRVCSAASRVTTSRQRASRAAATGSRSAQRCGGGGPSAGGRLRQRVVGQRAGLVERVQPDAGQPAHRPAAEAGQRRAASRSSFGSSSAAATIAASGSTRPGRGVAAGGDPVPGVPQRPDPGLRPGAADPVDAGGAPPRVGPRRAAAGRPRRPARRTPRAAQSSLALPVQLGRRARRAGR